MPSMSEPGETLGHRVHVALILTIEEEAAPGISVSELG